MASKRRQSVYDKKRVQGTYYTTREAAQKLRAAQQRAGGKGRQATASDVITFSLMVAADWMTEAAAEFMAQPDAHSIVVFSSDSTPRP